MGAVTTHRLAFQLEVLDDCQEELGPLIRAHHAEVAFYPDIALDVDWDAYRRLERAGVLRLYTARDFGGLRGYACYIVAANPHYKGRRQANADALYLDPTVRGHLTGVRFLEWCDARLRAEGVSVVVQHHPAKRPTQLYRRLGYELSELVWTRRLDV